MTAGTIIAAATRQAFARDWAPVALDVVVHWRTTAALLVSTDGQRASAFWIPQRLTIVDEVLTPSVWTITIPAWLAADRSVGEFEPETA